MYEMNCVCFELINTSTKILPHPKTSFFSLLHAVKATENGMHICICKSIYAFNFIDYFFHYAEKFHPILPTRFPNLDLARDSIHLKQ